MLMDRFDGGFAAKSATRGCENMAGEPLEVHLDGGPEKHIQSILMLGGFALLTVRDIDHVAPRSNEAFREQESHSEFFVMARRAHRDGDAVAANADFQRLLARQPI